jgi:hypothetical protein
MSKEKQIELALELFAVNNRISELKRSKTYFTSSSIYNNRLRVLETEKSELKRLLKDKETEVKKVKFTINVDEKDFSDDWDEEKIVQYLKRSHLERS